MNKINNASVKRLFDKCLIVPDDIKPSQEGLEVIGTFNPGAVKFDGTTYILVRVAEMPVEERSGKIALPRVKNGNIFIDWEKTEDVNVQDKRSAKLKKNGLLRLTNVSHLRLAKSKNGVEIDSIGEIPAMFPEEPYEEFGIEDPRITPVGDKFYITYVAVSRYGIVTALASTEDFIAFERHGVIFPTDNKDVTIFPDKIKGNYVALHRPLSAAPIAHPGIWVAFSPDLIHWGNHSCIIEGGMDFASMRIGAGVPPIKTEEGWLEIYHGSHKSNDVDTVGIYSAGAVLFALDEPERVIGKSKHPILVAETEYERKGFLENIIFPSGIVVEEDKLFFYCGAADTYTSVVELSLRDILETVKA